MSVTFSLPQIVLLYTYNEENRNKDKKMKRKKKHTDKQLEEYPNTYRDLF